MHDDRPTESWQMIGPSAFENRPPTMNHRNIARKGIIVVNREPWRRERYGTMWTHGGVEGSTFCVTQTRTTTSARPQSFIFWLRPQTHFNPTNTSPVFEFLTWVNHYVKSLARQEQHPTLPTTIRCNHFLQQHWRVKGLRWWRQLHLKTQWSGWCSTRW